MRTLHLTLHRRWFIEILSGRKIEEYRAKSPYWQRRLVGQQYDRIVFRNGYRPDSPKIEVECTGMRSARFEGQPVFALQLGRIVSVCKEARKLCPT